MADTERKPRKIDLSELLGIDGGGPTPGDPAADPGEVVVLDPSGTEAAAGPLPHPAATPEALRSAQEEKEKYYDLWVRSRADFENLRKRVEREREEESARAGSALVKELLPALDSLERASAQAAPGDPVGEGIGLILRQLKEALTRAGLEPIEAVGEVFDPLYHEAVAGERTDRIEPNRVIEEIQRGYTFRGRVLRPSLVRVSVAMEGGSAGSGRA